MVPLRERDSFTHSSVCLQDDTQQNYNIVEKKWYTIMLTDSFTHPMECSMKRERVCAVETISVNSPEPMFQPPTARRTFNVVWFSFKSVTRSYIPATVIWCRGILRYMYTTNKGRLTMPYLNPRRIFNAYCYK